MKYLILIVFLLQGCSAVYEVKRCEGDVCSYAKIKSRRDFPSGIEIKYNGEERTFEFSANKVESQVSPLETAAAQILLALPDIVKP